MKYVKVRCPNCNAIVKGEISTHLYGGSFINGYYAECHKCHYEITKSEWDEIKELDKTE